MAAELLNQHAVLGQTGAFGRDVHVHDSPVSGFHVRRLLGDVVRGEIQPGHAPRRFETRTPYVLQRLIETPTDTSVQAHR